MKRVSFLLSFLTSLLICYGWPAFADEKPGHFFGALDYYLAGEIGDEINNNARDRADSLTSSGEPSSISQDVSDGLGFRIGYLKKMSPKYSVGGSLGYIRGPKIETTLTDLPSGSSAGTMKETDKNSYIRLMAEGMGRCPISEKISLNLGVGLGLGQGRTDQEFIRTGTYSVIGNSTASDDTIGFTWEISPAVEINLEKVALSLGLRYTQLPKIKGTEDISEIDWKAFGFFAGLSF